MTEFLLTTLRRYGPESTARTVVMYLLRENQFSFNHIASELGMKSHTTVLKNLQHLEQRLTTDARLLDAVAQVKRTLKEPEPVYSGEEIRLAASLNLSPREVREARAC